MRWGEHLRLDANMGDAIVQSVLPALARGDGLVELAANPEVRAASLRTFAAKAGGSLDEAVLQLRRGGAPLADAADGVAQLADRMRVISGASQVRAAIRAPETTDAVAGAANLFDDLARELVPATDDVWRHRLRDRLASAATPREVESIVEAMRLARDPATTPATVRSMLEAALPSTFREPTHEELRTVAILDQLPAHLRPPELPDARRMAPILSQFTSGHRDSQALSTLRNIERELEASRIVADPATTRTSVAAEFASLIDTPAEEVTNDQLRRLAAIQYLPEELRPVISQRNSVPLVQIYPMMKYYDPPIVLESELAYFRMLAERERIVAGRVDTVETLSRELDELLTRDPATWSRAELTRAGAIDLLPPKLRPDLPPPTDEYTTLAQRLTDLDGSVDGVGAGGDLRNVQVHRARLALASDPASNRATLTAELDELLALPNDELRTDRLARLAAITSAPESIRPTVGDLHGSEAFGRLFIDPVRYGEDRAANIDVALERLRAMRALDDGPVRSTETIVPELERLVALDALDEAQWRHLRVLVNASDEVKWAMPSSMTQAVGDVLVPGALPARRAADMTGLRIGLDDLRLVERSARLADDPTTTRTAMTAELSTLLGRNDEDLTRTDLLRMATIAGLPDAVRPPIVSSAGGATPRRLWIHAANGELGDDVTAALSRQRRLTGLDDPGQLRAFVEQLDAAAPAVAGDDLDDLATLIRADAEHVRRAGATDELLDRLVGDLAGEEHARARLALARELIPPVGANAAADELAANTHALIQRNFDRLDGVLHDGFARDPDYADLGRIRANLTVLRSLGSEQLLRW